MFRGPPDAIDGFAASQGHRLAVHDFTHDRAWSYDQLNAAINGMAGRLGGLVAPGDRVAMLARNGIELIVAMYATIRCGGVFVPLNWRLRAPEIAGLLDDCRPTVTYYQAEFAGLLTGAAAAGQRLLIDDGLLQPSVQKPLDRRPRLDQTAIILYTSGTTGRPKGVCVSGANALATSRNFAAVTDVREDSRLLCDSPMFHVMGLLAITRTTLWKGASLYVSSGFSAKDTVARVADRDLGLTHYLCVPQMLQMLRDADGFHDQAFRRLRGLFVGGAPLPLAVAQPWLDDGVQIINGYGMTEAGTAIHMPLDDAGLARRVSSIGLPAPFIRVRLSDRDGRPVRTGEVGEVWLKGPSLTSGYWNQAEATRQAFKGGWYRTGDAARCDANGYYHLVDRWKDMYISGGENVYPAEVEATLLTLPGVREAAVVACPDDRWGEIGVAFIVADPAATLDAAQVIAHCRQHLAGFKAPQRVRFVETLPRTSTGKVQKAALRAMAVEAAV